MTSTVATSGQHRLNYRHQKVQRLRRLLRKRSAREAEGVFVVEGAKVLAEAVAAGASVETVFRGPGAWAPVLDDLQRKGVRIFEFDDGVLERVADTVTPQPVLAVVATTDKSWSAVRGASSVVVLADVRDPGNAGTVLRSAEAAGIGAVVICEGSVDLYNPKTVRSSAGALFHVPVVLSGTTEQTFSKLREAGFVTMGTTMQGGSVYDETDLTRRIALVFGNEANGLPEAEQASLDELVSIPIDGRSESLNVSMAASILCFETARQRRMTQR